MAKIDAPCAGAKAFSFVQADQIRIGLINKMSFSKSGKVLAADIPINNPENPDEKLQAVAVMNHITWNGLADGSFVFKARMTPKNKSAVQEATSNPTGGAEMEIDFTVFEYDLDKKTYFKRLDTGGESLKFSVTPGTDPDVGEEPNDDVKMPITFDLTLSVVPRNEGSKQQVTCAFTSGNNFQREIGTNVAQA